MIWKKKCWRNLAATNQTGTTNAHTNAIACVQTEMSLSAAVILTNFSDWKDIFGSYYLYFRSLLDKRVEWMRSGRFEAKKKQRI